MAILYGGALPRGVRYLSSAATDALSGGAATPHWVTSAVTSCAGVTSKAGLRQGGGRDVETAFAFGHRKR